MKSISTSRLLWQSGDLETALTWQSFRRSFFASIISVMELTLHKASFHLAVVNFSKVIGAQTNTPPKKLFAHINP